MLKKIVSLMLTVVFATIFASCSSKDPTPQKHDNSVSKARVEVISTFGITVDESRIVCYEGEDEYLKYIIVKYEDGEKKSEYVYYFYYDEAMLERTAAKFDKDAPAEINKEAQYIKIAGNEANTGDFQKDKAKLAGKYTIK